MTRAREESGFTLIELAIAATLSFILFAATLTVLTSLINQRNRVEQQAEVETQARLTVDRMARQLRNLASPADVITSVAVSTQPKSVDRNLSSDLIFKDVAEDRPPARSTARTCAASGTACRPPEPHPASASPPRPRAGCCGCRRRPGRPRCRRRCR